MRQSHVTQAPPVTRRALLTQAPGGLAALVAGLVAAPAAAKPAPDRGMDPEQLASLCEEARRSAAEYVAELKPADMQEAALMLSAQYRAEKRCGPAYPALGFARCSPLEPQVSCRRSENVTTWIYLPDQDMDPWDLARVVLLHIGLMEMVEPPQISATLDLWDIAAAQTKVRPVGEAFVRGFEALLPDNHLWEVDMYRRLMDHTEPAQVLRILRWDGIGPM